MKNKEYMSLKKMIEYINKALRYTEGCDFKTFSDNEEKGKIIYERMIANLENIIEKYESSEQSWMITIIVIIQLLQKCEKNQKNACKNVTK